ncbi:MAG: hypothetical protein L0J80_01010 [Lactococcus sp.]|nr:hypothetical protein [Lactococcus sp.]
MTYYIGFDIGGTSIKYGLVDEQGDIIEKGLFPSTPDDGELLLKNGKPSGYLSSKVSD